MLVIVLVRNTSHLYLALAGTGTTDHRSPDVYFFGFRFFVPIKFGIKLIVLIETSGFEPKADFGLHITAQCFPRLLCQHLLFPRDQP